MVSAVNAVLLGQPSRSNIEWWWKVVSDTGDVLVSRGSHGRKGLAGGDVSSMIQEARVSLKYILLLHNINQRILRM